MKQFDLALPLTGLENLMETSTISISKPIALQPGYMTKYPFDLNRSQQAFWNRIFLLKKPDPGTLDVRVSFNPCFAEEIESQNLMNRETGLFQRSVFLENKPRVATALRVDGVLVAHALLMPTTIEPNGCAPIPKKFGHKIGLLGVFVAPEHRGKGYAKACLTAIENILVLAKKDNPMTLMAEQRIVPLCRTLFSFPVIARWNNQREDFCKL